MSELKRIVGTASQFSLSAGAYHGLQEVLGAIMVFAMEEEDMTQLSALVLISQVSGVWTAACGGWRGW